MIWKFTFERNNFLNPAHYPWKQNALADRESNDFNDRTCFPEIIAAMDPLDVDLFASRLN